MGAWASSKAAFKMEKALLFIATNNLSLKPFGSTRMTTVSKAIKFVPAYGLHRTPLCGRRLLLALKS